MSIDFPLTTDPPASAYSLQNGFLESHKHKQPDHAYSNGIQNASSDFKHDGALKFGNTCSTTTKMGNFGSKKKKRLAKDAPEEDVWKKKEDVEESNRNGKQKGKKKKKRKKEKNKSKTLENTQTLENTPAINHDLLTHPTEHRSPHLNSSPHRSRKFVKDLMCQRGIKMADESSSSSQGCGTPIPTPPTRRQAHPVFKVTTPPPPRRTIDNTSSKISSPTLQRVRHQGHSDKFTVPSPPMRRANTDDQCAPELPPRRSRCAKLTSPVLSRKIDGPSSIMYASPVLNRKVNESCNTSGSPRIVRQGSGRTRGNREDEDRAPTPPPRKSSVSSKSSSPKVGSPSVRRAYPVFKVDTPPPARRDYNVNLSSDAKQDKILKGKEHTLNGRGTISTKPPQELVYARIDKGSECVTVPTTTQSDMRGNNVAGDTTNSVELRNKGTTQNGAPRVVISPYRNSMILEQGQPITLSIEADEENYRNIMKENSNKCESRSDATMSVLPGPTVAVKSTIPPPERAVISNVPPPSPSSIDILEENEEDLLECNESETKNKEIEQFGEIVSRRLSMLLESKDMMYEESEFSDSNGSCSESRLESVGNKGTHIRNFRDLDDYDWVEPIDGSSYLTEPNKSVCDRSLKSIKTPEGYHEATSLDLENNNYSHEKKDQISNKAPDLLTSNQCNVGSKIDTTCLNKDKARKDDKYFEPEKCPRKIRSFDYKDYARDLTPRKRYTKDVPGMLGEVSSTTAKAVYRNTIDDEYPVFEDKIIPTSVKRKSLLDELEYKRESDVICDVISSYATPEEEEKALTSGLKSDTESESQEPVVSKQNINLQQSMAQSAESKQPSRLDQSLQKIFKMPVVDDTYSKLLPVEAFLEDVMESDAMPVPASYPTFNIEDTIRIRRQVTGRQSVTRTESDLDISEHMGDDSSDSMLADDEDELGSGEIIFSRTYPDSKHTPRHLVSSALKDRTFHDEYSDDNIWDDDDENEEEDEEDEDEDDMNERSHNYGKPSIGDYPDLIDFSSSFYSSAAPVDAGDVVFDSARRQMHDIHSHLQNLRQQMESLADKAEGSNLRPSLCLDRRSKVVSE